MTKEEAQRLKAGALALFMAGSMTLTGCTSKTGFEYTTGEDNKAVAVYNSYINTECLKKCVVAEVYNVLLDEKQLYIVRELETSEGIVFYSDLLNPTSTIFYEDNENNNFLKLVKTTPVLDYVNALGLSQMKYSHDDMVKILEEILAVYEFSDELVLTK